MSEPDAMKSLDDLDAIARKINDLALVCAVFDMRSDYYSVNQGFNTTSTRYLQDAINFAFDNKLPAEEANALRRIGVYYDIYNKNALAARYFLFALEKYREVGFEKVPDIGDFFIDVASFYYSIGDYDNSRIYLNLSRKYQRKNTRNYINVLNTLALTYRNTGIYPTALKYFDQAISMARSIGDSAYVGIITGNIGSVYFLQHQYKKALPFIEFDYRESIKYKQRLNAAIAALRLVKMNIETDHLPQAAGQLNAADSLLLRAGNNVLQHRVDFYELKAQLNEKMGNLAEANRYRKRYDEAKDSLAVRNNVAAVERVRLQWEIERGKAQLNKVKQDAEVSNFKRNMVIVVLMLLIVISILIYNRQRLKAKKDQQLLASEKRRLDEELKNAALELNGYTENLSQKNLLIDQFKIELEKLRVQFNDENGAQQLDELMRAHIMTEENWSEFKKLFAKVHPAFFYNLRNAYPQLTNTDVRLMALIKLNLSNREMAGMLGITTDGVKKAKQRLRKKIEIDAVAEIEEITDKL